MLHKCHSLEMSSHIFYRNMRMSSAANLLGALTLKVPVTFTAALRQQCFIFIFFIVQRKQVLTFHVNHLPSRGFRWNVRTCFLWKIKIKFPMLSATNFALRFKGWGLRSLSKLDFKGKEVADNWRNFVYNTSKVLYKDFLFLLPDKIV